jgi:hypothetical protein
MFFILPYDFSKTVISTYTSEIHVLITVASIILPFVKELPYAKHPSPTTFCGTDISSLIYSEKTKAQKGELICQCTQLISGGG